MIDVRCTVVNKVHRGQDFERLYCRSCPHRTEATIEVREDIRLLDGIGNEVTIACPNLKFYQSYVPLTREDTSQVGKSTSISYYVVTKRGR